MEIQSKSKTRIIAQATPLGGVQDVTLNGASVKEGDTAHVNAATSVTVNGTTSPVDARGVLDVGDVATSITVNGTTYDVDSNGNVDLGSIGGGGSVTAVKVNNVTNQPDADGVVDCGGLVKGVDCGHGSLYPNQYGQLTFNALMDVSHDTTGMIGCNAVKRVTISKDTTGVYPAIKSVIEGDVYGKSVKVNGTTYVADVNGVIDIGAQGGGGVTDVEVNGTSVVTGGVAEVNAATAVVYWGVSHPVDSAGVLDMGVINDMPYQSWATINTLQHNVYWCAVAATEGGGDMLYDDLRLESISGAGNAAYSVYQYGGYATTHRLYEVGDNNDVILIPDTGKHYVCGIIGRTSQHSVKQYIRLLRHQYDGRTGATPPIYLWYADTAGSPSTAAAAVALAKASGEIWAGDWALMERVATDIDATPSILQATTKIVTCTTTADLSGYSLIAQ